MVNEWLIFGACSVLGGVFGGAVICWLRLSLFENQLANRLYMTQLSSKGVEARAAKEARLQSAVIELAAAVKQGTPLQECLKTLAVKYPDVAQDLLKKGLEL